MDVATPEFPSDTVPKSYSDQAYMPKPVRSTEITLMCKSMLLRLQPAKYLIIVDSSKIKLGKGPGKRGARRELSVVPGHLGTT